MQGNGAEDGSAVTERGAAPDGGIAQDGSAAAEAARRRAGVEIVAGHAAELRRTAARYSLCPDDVEDALQRTLEILLVKAPTERTRELLGWSKTVIKHEALAIRQNRERLLGRGRPDRRGFEADDRIAQLPAREAGPEERLERGEEIARSREALRALKPAELRALTLLAEGYSYAEIGEITGFTQTKINRSLAEGRERFRRMLSSSESGGRCNELSPLLSAFCDGEASPAEAAKVREHLRACGRCRATLRAYRTAPATVAALAPTLPVARSLLERVQELALGVQSRLPGVGAAPEASAGAAAAAGTKGIGTAALAKLLAVCAGTVGGAACVATGIGPAGAVDLTPGDRPVALRIERIAPRALEIEEPATAPSEPEPAPAKPVEQPLDEAAVEEAAVPAPAATEAEAVEYPEAVPPAPVSPAPAPEPPPPEPPSASTGSAAGEFGP